MEHFIETVRKYPCLWNTTAIEYRDQELKDAAWAEVIKETDLSSVREAKQRWKKLRDSFRDSLKREEAAMGGGRRHPPWKHATLMAFLAPHMGGRKRPPDPEPQPELHKFKEEPEVNGDSSGSSSSPPPPRRRRTAPPVAISQAAAWPASPDEPLAAFFGSMCMATRRLPLASQLAVKRALFAAVLRAESAAAGCQTPQGSDSDSEDARRPNENNH